jgi:hypothetical protein
MVGRMNRKNESNRIESNRERETTVSGVVQQNRKCEEEKKSKTKKNHKSDQRTVDFKVVPGLHLLADPLFGTCVSPEGAVLDEIFDQSAFFGRSVPAIPQEQRVVGTFPEVGKQVFPGPGTDRAAVLVKVRSKDRFVDGSGRLGELHKYCFAFLFGKELGNHVVLPTAQHKGGKEMLELFVRGLFISVFGGFVDKVFEHLLRVVVRFFKGRTRLGKQWHDERKHVQEFLRIVLHGGSREEQAVLGFDLVQHFITGGFGIFQVVGLVDNSVSIRRIHQKTKTRVRGSER